MSYEITRWIFLIGEAACAFGLAAVIYCIILKIILSYQKTNKNDDSQAEISKTEEQEQSKTVITKETQFANVRSILMIAIGIVVVVLNFYFSSCQQWILIFITSLTGLLLVKFVSTLGKKNENDRNKR